MIHTRCSPSKLPVPAATLTEALPRVEHWPPAVPCSSLKKRASQEIHSNGKLPAFDNLLKKMTRRVQSPKSITPSMKTGTTKRILLDYDNLEALFGC